MLSECEEWPLAIRREFITLKYIMKLDSLRSHISKSILLSCAMPTLEKKLEKKFPSRWKPDIDFLRSLCPALNIQGVVTSNNPPWMHHPIDADVSLLSSSHMFEKAPKKQNAAKYIRDNYSESTLVFTDGSRTLTGKVGSSVYIPDLHVDLYYRLPDHLSAFTAELDAIYSTISLVVQLNISKSLIVTDSLRVARCLGDLAPV